MPASTAISTRFHSSACVRSRTGSSARCAPGMATSSTPFARSATSTTPPPASSRRRSNPTPRPSRDRREAKLSHAEPQRPAQPHRLHQGDAEDHQGHADGGGLEAAPRAGGGGGGASLRDQHGQGARQYRRLGGRIGGRTAASARN